MTVLEETNGSFGMACRVLRSTPECLTTPTIPAQSKEKEDEKLRRTEHGLNICAYPKLAAALQCTIAEKDAVIEAKAQRIRDRHSLLSSEPLDSCTQTKSVAAADLREASAMLSGQMQHAIVSFLYPELICTLQRIIAEEDALIEDQDAQIAELDASLSKRFPYYSNESRTRENGYYGMNCL